jgi:hypothetical protein
VVQQNSTGPAALFLGGNVGIGTTSPATTFSVTGSGYFDTALGVGGVNTTANTILIGSSANAAYASFGGGRGYAGYDGEGTIGLRLQGGSGRGIAFDVNNSSFGSGEAARITAAGLFGVGTTTPYSRLEVWGPDTASTTAFTVVNSASTTEFAVYDTGNATLAGGLIQNSDQRLKTNVQPLNASSSLSMIDQLNPVTFNWIDTNKGTTPQLGFIAQQVLPIFPNLVATTSPTALTPDGTLSLNYIDLISPIVSAIQALSSEVTSIENTIAGFADSFTTNQLTFVRGQGTEVDVQTLCIGSTCITENQLKALLASADQAAGDSSSSSNDSNATSSAPSTPPVISVNGDNPAIVQVGATYNDLGATITGPQADLNLGITTFLNGTLTSNIVIDTSQAATDTIDYVATAQNGLTSTSTRTVIVEAPEASSPPATNASSTVATSSSTVQ